MKLLVVLFLFELYTRINIFKLIAQGIYWKCFYQIYTWYCHQHNLLGHTLEEWKNVIHENVEE